MGFDELLFFVEARLDELEQYLGVTEEYLEKARNDWVVSAEQALEQFSPDERNEYSEILSDDYGRYTDDFPRILRSSFLVSAFSLFEHETGKFCNRLRWQKQIAIGRNRLKGNVLEQLKDYFKLAGISLSESGEAWQQLADYNTVRNCIVHNNGLVKGFKDEKQLTAYATKRGILANTLIEGPEVALNEEFCREVIETMRTFWRKVNEAYI